MTNNFFTAEPLKIGGQNPFNNSFGKDLFGTSVPATVRICASLWKMLSYNKLFFFPRTSIIFTFLFFFTFPECSSHKGSGLRPFQRPIWKLICMIAGHLDDSIGSKYGSNKNHWTRNYAKNNSIPDASYSFIMFLVLATVFYRTPFYVAFPLKCILFKSRSLSSDVTANVWQTN